jgi:hypothetical protein
VIVASPLLARGSDSDRCGSDLPIADAASLGCAVRGTVDQLVQGSAAASALEDGTVDVDIVDGWSEADVVRTLRDDEAAWLDPNAGIFFADPIHHLTGAHAEPTPPHTARARAAATALPDLSAALRLHSRPGATRTIHIDVDGHVTSHTVWNRISGRTIVSAPFDMDGDPSRFSSLERTAIRAVWQRVSEDFAPFDVDVTTEDPGVGALTRSGHDDESFGVRVIVTSTNWYASGVGGLAHVGSYDEGAPAFVFSSSLGNVVSHIAEAVSHETGHSLGLRHDGTATSGYSTGHAGWAPIMGIGFHADLVQWSKGEYSGASNTEDDVAMIASHIPFADDDHGDTAATATALDLGDSAQGVISTAADVDAFTVDVAAGSVTFTARGAALSSNLDTRLRLLDATGRRVASSNPARRLEATITRDLSAGRYVLLVEGVGRGHPSTGYSDYGSLGRYTITAEVVPLGSRQRPVARFTTSPSTVYVGQRVVFDGRTSDHAGGRSISSYRWRFSAPTTRAVTGSVAVHTWRAPGTYDVRLTVVDDGGRRSSSTRTVRVLRPSDAP